MSESLKMPLFSLFRSLEGRVGISGNIGRSLQKLFICYSEIMKKSAGDNKFSIHDSLKMENDIESYIIRERILFNDIAWSIRMILPKEIRGLRSLDLQKDDEMRFDNIINFVKNNPESFKGLTKLINKNKEWIENNIKQRDDIIHFKKNVLVFKDSELSFSFLPIKINDNNFYKDSDGYKRIKSTVVFKFINDKMVRLLSFLNDDVFNFILSYANENKIEVKECLLNKVCINYVGVSTYLKVNEK